MTVSANSEAHLCGELGNVAPVVQPSQAATQPTVSRPQVLIAHDDPAVRASLQEQLSRAGYTPEIAPDGPQAQQRLTARTDVALVGARLAKANNFLGFARERFPELQVILLGGPGEQSRATQARNDGAFDFLTPPLSPESLLVRIEQAAEQVRLRRENASLRRPQTAGASDLSTATRDAGISGSQVANRSETGADGQAVSPGQAFDLACKTLAEVEKQAIIATLHACRGNKAQTARVLGISEKSIYNKMRRHGLRKAKTQSKGV